MQVGVCSGGKGGGKEGTTSGKDYAYLKKPLSVVVIISDLNTENLGLNSNWDIIKC